MRKHKKPRVDLYIPDDTCPLELHWFDLYRVTKTSLPAEQECEIKDLWHQAVDQPCLSAPWVGEAYFEPRHPRAKPGYEWQNGRETKLQRTDRPPSVRPETWRHLNKEARRKEISKWQSEASARSEAREARQLGPESHNPDLDIPKHKKSLQSLTTPSLDVPS